MLINNTDNNTIKKKHTLKGKGIIPELIHRKMNYLSDIIT